MNLSRSKIFLVFCLSFIAGVFFGRFLNYQIMAAVAIIFVIIIAIAWTNRAVRLIGFAGLILLLGAFRFVSVKNTNYLTQFYQQKVEVGGTIVEEPDKRVDKTYLTLGRLEINGKEEKGKILLRVARFPEYAYGDRLTLSGKIVEPKDAQQPGEFSYKNYLSRFGVSVIIYSPKILQAQHSRGNMVKAGILKVKQMFVESLERILPEPKSAFLAGLLVGNKRSIPQNLLDEFAATCTSHIIAISGYNITIIVWALGKALERFGRRVSFALILASIVGFVILTGATASVIRAGIMGALVLIALNVGRVHAITNALVFTAALMLLINPLILHFDIGFQLSFLALMGLVYLSPLIEEYLMWLPKFFRTNLVATLSAQIFTIPILLYNFNQLSLIAPLTNVLVLSAVPITMLFGFLAGIAGLISALLALPFTAVSWILLGYILKVVDTAAKIPFAQINVSHFSILLFWFYYLLLTVFLTVYYHPNLWKLKPKTI